MHSLQALPNSDVAAECGSHWSSRNPERHLCAWPALGTIWVLSRPVVMRPCFLLLTQERVGLSKGQQEQIVALRAELLQKMDGILQERRATFATLQVPPSLPALCQGPLHALPMGLGSAPPAATPP